MSLNPGQVHYWSLSTNDLRAWLLPEKYSKILSLEEVNRFTDYRSRQAQLEYLAGKLMVRALLSRYFPLLDPNEWRFSLNEYGKPKVINSVAPTGFEFNLSHSGGKAVCAFTLGSPLGIDIEATTRKIKYLELAKDSFSQAEVASLHGLTPDQLAKRFYEYWTLKEAYIKARGMGLALPLDQFTFQITDSTVRAGHNHNVSIVFGKSIEDDPTSWHFKLIKEPGFQLALAIKSNNKSIEVIDRGPVSLPGNLTKQAA